MALARHPDKVRALGTRLRQQKMALWRKMADKQTHDKDMAKASAKETPKAKKKKGDESKNDKSEMIDSDSHDGDGDADKEIFDLEASCKSHVAKRYEVAPLHAYLRHETGARTRRCWTSCARTRTMVRDSEKRTASELKTKPNAVFLDDYALSQFASRKYQAAKSDKRREMIASCLNNFKILFVNAVEAWSGVTLDEVTDASPWTAHAATGAHREHDSAFAKRWAGYSRVSSTIQWII